MRAKEREREREAEEKEGKKQIEKREKVIFQHCSLFSPHPSRPASRHLQTHFF